ncbi:DUF3618 domain-containing protein [Marmoricola sp. RAF53]|uniref:DUF3618 domain-containing protein n=1 Tax=Marmoricola sp. RAF53 TaxID=3233059 RepID=UPI003F96C540
MADKNLGSLENDVEITRARLASTIDQLAYRTSPKTIAKREANQFKAYFVDENGPRTENIVKVVGGVVAVIVAAKLLRKIVG